MRLTKWITTVLLVSAVAGPIPARAQTVGRAAGGAPNSAAQAGATRGWWATVVRSIGAANFGLSYSQAQLGDWMVESDQARAQMGRFVGPAGDVNGDGYDDVIVGADYYDGGQTDEGKAYVYNGSPTGLSTTPSWTFESDQAGALLGHSVWTAQDVNGDGYDDVIVGANLYDNGQQDEGRAYVFHGSAQGLSKTPNWTAESDQPGASFGRFVWRAGDVNGDGYDDVIIGAPFWDNRGYTDAGKAYAYYGSPSGLSRTPNWTQTPNQSTTRFGQAVSTAGDVNSDGYADVLVGADFFDHGQTDEGAAFAYYGSPTGLSPTYNWRGEADQVSANYGYWVDKAGDVNGDGYGDIVIGANAYSHPESHEGRSYVYLGSANGLERSAVWMDEANQHGALYGYSCGTAGDVNGDGYDDILITAERWDSDLVNVGKAYIYLGSPSGPSVTPDWTIEGEQEFAQLGYSSGGAGDVDGDGLDDIIIGMPQWNDPELNEGAAVVWYGSGLGLAPFSGPRGLASGGPG